MFLKNLFHEIAANGKLLTGYLLTQLPVTSFPGVITSVKTALTDRTPAAYADVGVQVLMAVAATLRAGKIVKTAVNKSK